MRVFQDLLFILSIKQWAQILVWSLIVFIEFLLLDRYVLEDWHPPPEEIHAVADQWLQWMTILKCSPSVVKSTYLLYSLLSYDVHVFTMSAMSFLFYLIPFYFYVYFCVSFFIPLLYNVALI